MDSTHLLLYLIASMALLWIVLYTLAKSRRAKQWLVITSILGVGWGPLFISFMNHESVNNYTILSSGWNMIELAILSGLSWGVVSTLILSRKSGVIMSPVKVNFKRLMLSYGVVALAIAIAAIFNFSVQIAAVATLGMGSLLLAVNNRNLLITSSLTALSVAAIASIIAIGSPFVLQMQNTQSLLQIANQDTLLAIQDIALIGATALAATVTPHWWLEQNLTSSTKQ